MRITDELTAETLQPLFELNADAIVLLDSRGFVQMMNKAVHTIVGYTYEALHKKSFVSFIEPEQICEFSRYFHLAQQGIAATFEVQVRHAYGHLHSLQLRVIPCNFAGEACVYVVMRDVTEQKLASQLIQHIAYHDTLTGLPNRTLFQIELTRRIAAASTEEPFSVMLIQLDRFQVITDSLGHNVGDLLIKMVSQRLELLLQPGDQVSRIGSNEFAILYRTPEHPQDAAERMNTGYEQLMEPYSVHDENIYLQIRIGSANFPQDGSDMTTLLRNAAVTRYLDEEKHYSWHLYSDAKSSPRAQDRLTLENDLRKALERGEFEVHYQPQYDIATNRLLGTEALLRWRHPVRGLVSPAEFIPAAEETGLIVPIGEWVLRTACEQNKRWMDSGYERLTVAVNLSIRQFQKHNIIGDVYKILYETRMDPTCLELEITESMAIDNVERVIRKLHELKNLGIRISMDDFGTGYSSLNYLKKIPINKLKIDQSFIRDIANDSDNAAIVTTIIAMAQHLKLEVVAEGVETADDLHFLQTHHCKQAQGYYFSRPLPVHEFEQLLQARYEVCV